MLSAMSCSDSMVSVPPVLTSMRSAVAVAPRRVVSPSALSEMFCPVRVVFCQVLLKDSFFCLYHECFSILRPQNQPSRQTDRANLGGT